MRSTTRDDRAPGPAFSIGWLAVTLALAVPAHAGPAPSLVWSLVGHYTSYESYAPAADGTREKLSRSFWSQDYRAAYSSVLQSRTRLFAELRYSDYALVGGAQRIQQPAGLLRVSAPVYGLTAQYRPRFRYDRVRTFTAEGDTGGVVFEDTRSHDADLILSGYVAPARLPRLEVLLSQQRRFASDRDPATSVTQHSIRASQEFGRLALRAGYADQYSAVGLENHVQARSWSGDASFNPILRAGRTLSLRYAVLHTLRPGGTYRSSLTSHTLNSTAGWRLGPRTSIDAAGLYRYSTQRTVQTLMLRDVDAYAYLHQLFSPWLSMQAGGGYRTRSGFGSTGDQPFLSASISADGRPRRGVQVRSSASHSTNWVPANGAVSSEGLSAGATFDVSRTFSAYTDANLSITTRPDTEDRFYASTFNVGTRMQPLGGLQANLSAGLLQNGVHAPGTDARARSFSANVLWRASRSLSFNLLHSSTGTMPNDTPRLTTTSASGDWQFGANFSFGGSYTRTTNGTAQAETGTRRSESYSMRAQGRLSRRFSLIVSGQQVDRGRPTERRSIDVTATYRFGT